jgi:hypothetical protein
MNVSNEPDAARTPVLFGMVFAGGTRIDRGGKQDVAAIGRDIPICHPPV